METIIRDGLMAADLELIKKNYEDGEQFTVVHPLIIPPVVMLPTEQHLGTPAKPVVDVDDHVLKGQLIAKATGLISANIHASTSGTVVAIAQRSINFGEAKRGTCIVIESDGEDKSVEYEPCPDFQQISSKDLIAKIRAAGIVDMDGEGLPVHVSLKPKKAINTIIISACHWNNAVNSDDVTLHNRAKEIVIGIKIIRQILDQPKRTVIAIESGKEQVMNAIFTAIENENLINCEVEMCDEATFGPDRQTLVETITQKKMNIDGLPLSIGAICLNVSTVYSIHRAVCLGEPTITQLITANGSGFDRRQTLAVPLGTPMSFILKEQKFKEDGSYTIRINNFQTGSLLAHQEAPVNKLVSGLWSVGTYPQLELEEESREANFLGNSSLADANKIQNEDIVDDIVSQAIIPDSFEEENEIEMAKEKASTPNPNMTVLGGVGALKIGNDQAEVNEWPDTNTAKENEQSEKLLDEMVDEEELLDFSAEVEKLQESHKEFVSEEKAAANSENFDIENIDDLVLDANEEQQSPDLPSNATVNLKALNQNQITNDEEMTSQDEITNLEEVIDNDQSKVSETPSQNPADLTVRSHNILRLQEKLKNTEDKLDQIDPSDDESMEAIMLSINVLIEKIQSAKDIREKEDVVKANKDANNLTLLKYMGSLQERLDVAQNALSSSDRANASTQSAVKGALSQLESKLKNALKSINLE